MQNLITLKEGYENMINIVAVENKIETNGRGTTRSRIDVEEKHRKMDRLFRLRMVSCRSHFCQYQWRKTK